MHVSKDVSYTKHNIVISFIYQVLDVNPKGMFWIVTNGKYQIIGKNVFNNFQNIVLTLGTIASVTNIVAKGVMMKEKPNAISHDFNFFVLIMESLFINLYDSSDKDDPTLPNVIVPNFVNLKVPK
jgi:hypothetical protein